MTAIHRALAIVPAIMLLAVLFMSAGATEAIAQKPTKDRQVFEMTYDIINPCTGEIIHMTDRYQARMMVKPDQDGCNSYFVQMNDMGSKGVTESGVTYQYPAVYLSRVSTSCDGCIVEETSSLTYSYVGKGSAPNFKVQIRYRVTYNVCTGEFSVIRESFSVTCDGEPLP